jgi:hypothetical protein
MLKKSDDQFEQYLRQFEPRRPSPLPEAEHSLHGPVRVWLAVAALIVVACGLVLLRAPQPLVHDPVLRSDRTDISDPLVSAAMVSLGRLNRLIQEDPAQLDAVLAQVSPAILPDVMQPNGSLYALAKD